MHIGVDDWTEPLSKTLLRHHIEKVATIRYLVEFVLISAIHIKSDWSGLNRNNEEHAKYPK